MNFVITLPSGSTHMTSSSEEVVSTLKTNGVRGLNKRKPPSDLKVKGTYTYVGCLGREISVVVK